MEEQAPLDFQRAMSGARLRPNPDYAPSRAQLQECFSLIAAQFDPVNGGFARVPKFPSPARLTFLSTWSTAAGPGSSQSREAVEMVEATLRAMARGGMRDFLGGGFFRYSLDDSWQRPYFEKLLLDQAELARCYLNGAKLTGRAEFATIAAETLAYADRELSSPEGGFYNGEHCDSPRTPGGEPAEGAFYVWQRDELRAAAGDAADLLDALFGLKERGNVPPGSDPFRTLDGWNVLHTARPLGDVAADLKLPTATAASLLDKGIESLRRHRWQRVRPPLDRLIVTQSNAVTISALARAGVALGEPAYLARAVRAAGFLRQHLWNGGKGVLYRCGTERAPSIVGCAEDYASTVEAALDLHELTGVHAWLEWAMDVQRALDANFWDEKDGGYFDSAHTVTDVPFRFKNDDDASSFASNAVAGVNLVRFASLLGSEAHAEKARRLLGAFAPHLERVPGNVAGLALVADSLVSRPLQVIVTGPADGEGATFVRTRLAKRPGARRFVCLTLDGPASTAWFAGQNAAVSQLPPPPPAGENAIYVASGFRVLDGPFAPAELDAVLDAHSKTK